MELSDLPQFTVLALGARRANDDSEIVGQLSHLRGVRNASGWLYRPGRESMCGQFEPDVVPSDAGVPLIFIASYAEFPPELAPGAVYPWLDICWQAYHLDMILEGPARWEHRVFMASPAHYFREGRVRGWQPAGDPLPDGVEDLGVRADAWDHEHCELCRATIGAGGSPTGYVDADDRWMCPTCFEQYVVRRDSAFVEEE